MKRLPKLPKLQLPRFKSIAMQTLVNLGIFWAVCAGAIYLAPQYMPLDMLGGFNAAYPVIFLIMWGYMYRVARMKASMTEPEESEEPEEKDD